MAAPDRRVAALPGYSCQVGVHGAPYLDLLLQHRREARETQAKSDAEPRPNVRPIAGLKADVVPVDELHRAYVGGAK